MCSFQIGRMVVKKYVEYRKFHITLLTFDRIEKVEGVYHHEKDENTSLDIVAF
jgi:hypothetical protein